MIGNRLANPGPSNAPTPTTAPRPPPAPANVTREQVERLRAELPPTVKTRSGQKTHGRWIDPNGNVHNEVSGKDDKYQAVEDYFDEIKVSQRPMRSADVEMKPAVHMRKNDIRSATLIINNRPCFGKFGCNALVPVLLPEGYTLTIYDPDGFQRTYHGGKTSLWFP
ncbi:DddA-like double-stranded DNA deaminase toxin [Actinokineospora iranica]|uniref:SCP1.201-like deaminase n=1 Tax=Actinokineospora iranica TaxID=1271860 RepID=A0A1G6M7E0_9PSEU|nr:SCP1.201-like deaminase [Actinokineospora iranica]